MIIAVLYEWCFAIMAIMLHRKIKRAGSLLLAGGLTVMSCLVTLRYIGSIQCPVPVFYTDVLPYIMMIVPPFSLTGLGLIIAKWDEYTGKEAKKSE